MFKDCYFNLVDCAKVGCEIKKAVPLRLGAAESAGRTRNFVAQTGSNCMLRARLTKVFGAAEGRKGVSLPDSIFPSTRMLLSNPGRVGISKRTVAVVWITKGEVNAVDGERTGFCFRHHNDNQAGPYLGI